MKPLILGSNSPRRREIMNYFTLPFKQVASSFDERSISFTEPVHFYAEKLSKHKASALADRFPTDIILTADTIVYHEGRTYDKPKDYEEAQYFLQQLQGKTHTVVTGVTVRHGEEIFSDYEETLVTFNTLNIDQIKKYHDTILWNDKCGGYTLQAAGALIMHKIDGCYYNVTGLPVNTVRKLLLSVNIDLWDYLK